MWGKLFNLILILVLFFLIQMYLNVCFSFFLLFLQSVVVIAPPSPHNESNHHSSSSSSSSSTSSNNGLAHAHTNGTSAQIHTPSSNSLPKSILFAVKYDRNAITHWDNNNSKNYSHQFVPTMRVELLNNNNNGGGR